MNYEADEGTMIERDSVEVLKTDQQVSLLAKAEIDAQVATAQAFPRSLKKSLDRIMSMATLTVEIAESCEFALPRGQNKDGTEKVLNGPSIRLAEIVFSQYGNLRAGMRVIYNDGKKVVAQGICHDIETNACVTLEVSRSILQHEWVGDGHGGRKKSGRMLTMSEDMQIVTGNAACAIAFRNAIFKVVPAAIVQPVYLATKELARGTMDTLIARREKALLYLHNLGVTDPQICIALGLQAVEDIDLDKLSIIRGICNAIKEGGTTVDQAFPKIAPKPAAGGKTATDATTAAIKAQQEKAAKNKKPTRAEEKKAAKEADAAQAAKPAAQATTGEATGKVEPK